MCDPSAQGRIIIVGFLVLVRELPKKARITFHLSDLREYSPENGKTFGSEPLFVLFEVSGKMGKKSKNYFYKWEGLG